MFDSLLLLIVHTLWSFGLNDFIFLFSTELDSNSEQFWSFSLSLQAVIASNF